MTTPLYEISTGITTGATFSIPITFLFSGTSADIVVTQKNTATNETKTSLLDFTFTIEEISEIYYVEGDNFWGAGVETEVYIYRNTTNVQEFDQPNGQSLDIYALIAQLDRTVRALQELEKKSPGEVYEIAITSIDPFTIASKSERKNKVIFFDENGEYLLIDPKDIPGVSPWERIGTDITPVESGDNILLDGDIKFNDNTETAASIGYDTVASDLKIISESGDISARTGILGNDYERLYISATGELIIRKSDGATAALRYDPINDKHVIDSDVEINGNVNISDLEVSAPAPGNYRITGPSTIGSISTYLDTQHIQSHTYDYVTLYDIAGDNGYRYFRAGKAHEMTGALRALRALGETDSFATFGDYIKYAKINHNSVSNDITLNRDGSLDHMTFKEDGSFDIKGVSGDIISHDAVQAKTTINHDAIANNDLTVLGSLHANEIVGDVTIAGLEIKDVGDNNVEITNPNQLGSIKTFLGTDILDEDGFNRKILYDNFGFYGYYFHRFAREHDFAGPVKFEPAEGSGIDAYVRIQKDNLNYADIGYNVVNNDLYIGKRPSYTHALFKEDGSFDIAGVSGNIISHDAVQDKTTVSSDLETSGSLKVKGFEIDETLPGHARVTGSSETGSTNFYLGNQVAQTLSGIQHVFYDDIGGIGYRYLRESRSHDMLGPLYIRPTIGGVDSFVQVGKDYTNYVKLDYNGTSNDITLNRDGSLNHMTFNDDGSFVFSSPSGDIITHDATSDKTTINNDLDVNGSIKLLEGDPFNKFSNDPTLSGTSPATTAVSVAALKEYIDNNSSQGGSLDGSWGFESFDFEPPGNGAFRINNAIIPSATKLWLSEFNSQGVNMGTIINNTIDIGSELVFQQSNDRNNYFVCEVTGITDDGIYVEIDITNVVSQGTIAYGTQFIVYIATSSGTLTNLWDINFNDVIYPVLPSGKLAIGADASSLSGDAAAHIIGSTTADTRMVVDKYTTNSNGPSIDMRSARGSLGTPAASVQNDLLGTVSGFGHDGIEHKFGGQIALAATENWTPTAQGTGMYFYVVEKGSTTQSVPMYINSNGAVIYDTDANGLYIGDEAADTWLLKRDDATKTELQFQKADGPGSYNTMVSMEETAASGGFLGMPPHATEPTASRKANDLYIVNDAVDPLIKHLTFTDGTDTWSVEMIKD